MSNKNNKIRVLIKRANQPPEVEEIENNLQSLQEIVGGLIEMPSNPKLKNIQIVCNEEGKLKGLAANLFWCDEDIICGDVLFLAHNKEGEAISLTDTQIDKAKEYILENDVGDFLEKYNNICNLDGNLDKRSYELLAIMVAYYILTEEITEKEKDEGIIIRDSDMEM